MKSIFNIKELCVIGIALLSVTCKKEKDPVFTPKRVRYEVTGTNFRLNFIDSVMGFRENQLHSSSFVYEFTKVPGTNIGISIFKQAVTDTIYSWRLSINGKLHANGFSEGGVYMPIPY